MRRLVLLALALAIPFVLVSPAMARDTISVYYAGPDGGVREALALTGDPDTFAFVTDPAQADVFLLNGVIPGLERTATRVREGAGLVLILGPALTAPEVESLLGGAVTLERRDNPLSLTSAPRVSDPVVTEIIWNSAPQIRERFHLGGGGLEPLAVQSYKFGGIVSAFLGAVLLAVADRFILGASGPEFVRAATYSIPLAIWGAVQYPSWVGDSAQLAANRPYLKSALVTGEQIIRVALAWILLERFQINALIFAYFVGLLAKGLVAYFVNHRLCFPQRFYAWQSLAAPLLAGAVHYALVRWVTGFIWTADQITSVLIFFVGIVPSFPVFAFLYGLLGGWDDDTLAELKSAAELSGAARPLAYWGFWAPTALGARLSPLHGRFPVDVRASALAEARSLTEERVKL